MREHGQSVRHCATLRAAGIDRWHGDGRTGRGVVVALADYGFDLLHPSFRDGAGRSRLAALWDQNGAGFGAAGCGSADHSQEAIARASRLPGELDRATIDRLITTAELTSNRDVIDRVYDPHANYYGRAGVVGGAHGSLMASIAAGSRSADHSGVAPEATLLAVQLALPDSGWREECAAGVPTWLAVGPDQLASWEGWRDYDAAPATVAALRYLYARAAALRPAGIVLNVSLGTWAGAHDGGSPVERELARIAHMSEAGEGPPCVVVVGAGNAGNDEGHVAADVTAATPASFSWTMAAADPTQNKLEIWYRAPRPLAFELAHRETAFALTVGPTRPLILGGQRVGIFDHTCDVRGGLSRVRIILHPPALVGHVAPAAGSDGPASFTFRLTARAGDANGGSLHAWLERDDGALARSTLSPSSPSSTLSCLAGATGAIVVGGFELDVGSDGGIAGARRFAWASHGPRPWPGASPTTMTRGLADHVPHLSAPAHGVVGAISKTTGYGYTSGTSAAAALVSGAAALLIEDAVARGRRPRRDDVLASLLGRADQPVAETDIAAWDGQLGFGPLGLASPLTASAALTSNVLSRNEHAGTHSRA